MSFLEAAPSALGTHPMRNLVFGFSQGATVAWALAAAAWPRATLVAGLAICSGRLLPEALDGSTPLGQKRELRADVLRARPAAFVTHGARDNTSPVALGRESVSLAQQAGIRVEYVEHEEGHALPREALMHAVRGLTQWQQPPQAVAAS